MPNTFSMPDVGEGLTEAQIVNWSVSVGDAVAVNQTLVEVETAKAVVELPSPYAGVVSELHFAAGEIVQVGAPIITIASSDDEQWAMKGAIESSASDETQLKAVSEPGEDCGLGGAEAVAEARQPVLVGYGVSHTAVERRARKPGWSVSRTPVNPLQSTDTRGYAKPPVRQLAKRLGVDLATVRGSGENGSVSRADVLAAQTVPGVAPAVRIPITGMRKHIAEAMVASAFAAPHVTEWLAVDLTRTLRLLASLREQREFAGLHITPLTLVARATVLALQGHPEINASWDGEGGAIVQHRDVNLGIAVASPRGLIVPNVPRVQNMRFPELAGALTNLVSEARANKTSPERMRGGTFTITNVGVFGVDGATPILNLGESAILAVGQIRKQPWNHKGRVKLRSVTTLSLSFDHRVVDGELGSGLLRDIARLLERPALALTW